MRRRKRVLALVLLAALVAGVVWWLTPERVRPFDESEIRVVNVEPPEPPEVVVPTVTMDVTEAPVSEVLAEMNKQAGVMLGADDATKAKRVTLQVKDVPVLQAFAEVASLTGSRVNWRDGVGLELAVDQVADSEAAITCAGPCLVAISTLPRTTTVLGTAASLEEWNWRCFVVARPVPLRGGARCSPGPFDGELRLEWEREPTLGGVTPGFSGWDLKIPPNPFGGTVTLTFGTAAEVGFDLKGDRGKRYRLGSQAITYMGLETHFYSVSWPWPLDRFLGPRERSFNVPAWRVGRGYGQPGDHYYKDSAGVKLDSSGMPVLRFQGAGNGGWEMAEVPPKGAKTLVVRTVPKTTELSYPFEFKEIPVRKPEGEERPSAP
jgi:hypothetical protein